MNIFFKNILKAELLLSNRCGLVHLGLSMSKHEEKVGGRLSLKKENVIILEKENP